MAISETSVCNAALQKLGATRITTRLDDSRNARSLNAAFDLQRDVLLRSYFWSFAKTRAILAPLATAPAFDYAYAFALPSDCLRVIKPTQLGLDWVLETQDGQTVILTNQSDTLYLRYVARITAADRFDPLFAEALACKLAWNCCEEITQSNEKKKDALAEFGTAISLARKTNAFETIAQESPDDTWDVARQVGGIDNTRRFFNG